MFENSRLSAARQCHLPMHSQSTNLIKLLFNSVNLAPFLLLNPVSAIGTFVVNDGGAFWAALPFLPAAKPSRSRRGESPRPPPGGKSRIEYLGDLIGMVSMVIGPTKFNGDLKLDQQSCSGPSRGATSAFSLWWKKVEGQKSHHRRNVG